MTDANDTLPTTVTAPVDAEPAPTQTTKPASEQIADLGMDEAQQQAFDFFLGLWTTGTTAGRRTPILRRPDDYGLAYEDVTFPSLDGTPLSGWYIPAPDTAGAPGKLVIHNHFLPGSRYGYAGQLPEFGGLGGFEVNFLPAYKALHDAGYAVLAYDLRNHGMSGQGNGGVAGIGLTEWQDVIGSVRYAKARPDTKDMSTALFSVCLGADSTAVAWDRMPEEFSEIQAMIMLQPVSATYIVKVFTDGLGLGEAGYAAFDAAVHERTGFHLAEQSPQSHLGKIDVPTLVAQVRDDAMTEPQDVQDIFDAIPVDDKKLIWIEGTTQRFRGYNYFGQHPEEAIAWFDRFVG